MVRQELINAKRIVVKVGSSSITGDNEFKLDLLVDAIAAAVSRGVEVILVTSGAIATGMPLLKLSSKPADLPTAQALAAVGQSRLIARYQHSLERYGLIAAQVLLTHHDLADAETRANAKAAMDKLVSLDKVVPIVNENDTVATAEIRFGDNDSLAAEVSVLASADWLILLSDIDALYNMNPSKPGAQAIEFVVYGDDLSGVELDGSSTGVGTGGAVTKAKAAKIATEVGVDVLLTSTDNVAAALTGEQVGTWFEANPDK
ncbi:MAG: glutamate 5-kinase [Micrococcales bacterium]